MQRWALTLVGYRLRGLSVPFVDDLKYKEFCRFTTIGLERLEAIMAWAKMKMPVDTTIRDIRDGLAKMLQSNFSVIQAVFMHYAASSDGDAGTMDNDEWMKFAADVALKEPKRVTESDLNEVFFLANEEGRYASMVPRARSIEEEMPADADDNPDTELNAGEFTEALVRVALLKYPKEPLLEVRVSKLVTENIGGRGVRSTADIFRETLNEEPVRNVMKRWKDALVKTFQFYAALDMSTNASKLRETTLSEKEISALIKDALLMDVGAGTIRKCFLCVQQRDPAGGTQLDRTQSLARTSSSAVASQDADLDFTAFQEFIAAMALHKLPTPYEPLSQRLERFFAGTLFPPLVAKGKIKFEPGLKKMLLAEKPAGSSIAE